MRLSGAQTDIKRKGEKCKIKQFVIIIGDGVCEGRGSTMGVLVGWRVMVGVGGGGGPLVGEHHGAGGQVGAQDGQQPPWHVHVIEVLYHHRVPPVEGLG